MSAFALHLANTNRICLTNMAVSATLSKPKSGFSREQRDIATERVLTENGFEFIIESSVPLDAFVRNENYQVRQKTDAATVNKYAINIEDGAVFPLPVAAPSASIPGKLDLIQGHHTTAGHMKATPNGAIACYVVTNLKNDDQAKLIGTLLNGHNGLPYNRAEAATAALVLRRQGKTLEAIARDLGVSAAKTRGLVISAEFADRCDALGIDHDGVPPTTRQHLAKLKFDNVFRAGVALAKDARLMSSEASRLATDVNAATSEGAMLEVVTTARADRAQQIRDIADGRDFSRPPSLEANRVIGHLLKLCATFPDKNDWVPTKVEARAEWHGKIQSASNCIAELMEAYDAANG